MEARYDRAHGGTAPRHQRRDEQRTDAITVVALGPPTTSPSHHGRSHDSAKAEAPKCGTARRATPGGGLIRGGLLRELSDEVPLQRRWPAGPVRVPENQSPQPDVLEPANNPSPRG